MNPAQVRESCNDLILERTLEISQGNLGHGHPMVLSCGGIFVPRPRSINPHDPLYHILYTPNDTTPAKIVSALIAHDILDVIMIKNDSH